MTYKSSFMLHRAYYVVQLFIVLLSTFSFQNSMSQTSAPNMANFTSQPPEKIMWELYRIRQRILLGEKIDMPPISLMLFPEGNSVTGYFVDMKDEGQEHHVAIELAGPNGPSGELFYAYLGAIRGVSIQNISLLEPILYEVTAKTKMQTVSQTSRLSVKKKAEEESAALQRDLEAKVKFEMKGELPEAAQHLFIISNLVTDVSMCLRAIAQDETGKQAIQEISAVVFDYTPQQADCIITYRNNVLILQGNFDRSFTTSIRRKELREKIIATL